MDGQLRCWRFGVHQLRVRNLNSDSPEIVLDGTPIEAPPGTMMFTGPGGALLELQHQHGDLVLIVDGTPAVPAHDEVGAGPSAFDGPLWWQFKGPKGSIHKVRAKKLGVEGQEVMVDGEIFEAPPGNLMFTGPGGCLLHFQKRGEWSLFVDEQMAERFLPVSESASMMVWNFRIPDTGAHEVRVANIGEHNQVVFVDGVHHLAPPDTNMFTGPNGCVLQLRRRSEDNAWILLVDGSEIETSSTSGSGSSQIGWTFMSSETGTHRVRVASIGAPGQQVFIDDVLLAAPDGTTTFTGPGGVLLELRQTERGWTLIVDGLQVEEYNAQSIAAGGWAAAAEGGGARCAVALDSLPQGVSRNADNSMFEANIRVRGKFVNLGTFKTPDEAHAAWQEAKKKYADDA
mmetsp:Transcript_58935/g.108883  ORF Transcript_58935/g.108883 Transcript_58935/m.108883 type:complete len:400 (+) Transcript_58935:103-1302(+)